MMDIKKTKYFWVYLGLGLLALLFALALAPFWGNVWEECPWKNLGFHVVSYIIAAAIVLYLVLYLFKRIGKSKGPIRILTIVEFTLLSLIAFGLVVSRFKVFNITNPSVIFGLALYVRGTVGVFKSNFQKNNENDKNGLLWLIIALALITIGVIFMVTKIITINVVLYILVVGLGLIGLYLVFYGLNSKQASKKINTSN